LKPFDALDFNLKELSGSDRIRTLYYEWDRVFGKMYGEDTEATEFTEVTPSIKESYGFDDDFEINSNVPILITKFF
jgi:hypothetical protein